MLNASIGLYFCGFLEVTINKNEKNTVTSKATFDDDTIKYDKVCWYGE